MGSFQREGGGCGLGQSLAQLTSLVQNLTSGAGKGGRGRNPGAGSILRLELAPFSRDGQCGEEEGRQRGFPSLPTSRTWAETAAGEAGQPASAHPTLSAAHSKVSHCFLSCSTEPGAAELMSCLVFCNKSSKGSLASWSRGLQCWLQAPGALAGGVGVSRPSGPALCLAGSPGTLSGPGAMFGSSRGRPLGDPKAAGSGYPWVSLAKEVGHGERADRLG